jgi:uracil-DNA glycosylase
MTSPAAARLRVLIPMAWQQRLAASLAATEFAELAAFVVAEYGSQRPVYPPFGSIFHALEWTPPETVRAVILGQDPYHGEGQAHGLCFSVPPGVRPPPSLRNIFREYAADLGLPPPRDGCLEPWARQGVLLLNTVLTVRAHQAHSHARRGWETFTDAVIAQIS